MKGKILEYGIILGDDGLKYSFSYDDIMNLSQKGRIGLENLGVDFIPDSDTATEIYLLIKENSATQSDTLQTKITRRKPKVENFESQNAQNDSENKESYYSPKSWQKGENLQNSQKTQIDSIKKKAYTMMTCYALGFLVVPLIVAVVFHIKLVLELQRVSHSKILLRNLILSIVAPLVAYAFVIIFSIFLGFTFNEIIDIFSEMDAYSIFLDKFGYILGIVLVLMIFIPTFYFEYLYSKELAYVTNQPYFMTSFWIFLVASLMSVDKSAWSISIVSYVICLIFYVTAWINFKEIIVKER